jgi:hypothetical protein
MGNNQSNKNNVGRKLYVEIMNTFPKKKKYNPKLCHINNLIDLKGISIDNINNLIALDVLNQYESSPKNINKIHQDMLYILNKCKCCDRHQNHKPTIYKPWVETTFNNTTNSYLLCACSCRHLARDICRQCTD